MQFMISFLALSAYSDYVEGRWQSRHNPQSHHESNTDTQALRWSPWWKRQAGNVFHPSPDKMPRAGVWATAIQRSRNDKSSLRPWSVKRDSERQNSVSRDPPSQHPDNQPGVEGGQGNLKLLPWCRRHNGPLSAVLHRPQPMEGSSIRPDVPYIWKHSLTEDYTPSTVSTTQQHSEAPLTGQWTGERNQQPQSEANSPLQPHSLSRF